VPDVYLDKSHKWVMEGVQFKDKLMYKDTQKEKKKGFLTGDFSRRDEFSMDFRTEQYREALKMESKHTAAATARAYKEMQAAMEKEIASGSRHERVVKPKPLLYDLVFDGEDAYPTAVKNSMISGRDTKNPTQLTWERNLGGTKLSSQECGYGIDSAPHGKPEFARIPIIEATFYRPCAIPITNTLYTQRPS
jgi:hypothetical protein